jgi:hypothetical protein
MITILCAVHTCTSKQDCDSGSVYSGNRSCRWYLKVVALNTVIVRVVLVKAVLFAIAPIVLSCYR